MIILHLKHLIQLPIFIYAIMISLIASLFALQKKDLPPYLKLFPFFLFITLLVELTATYLITKDISNVPVYNFFSIVEFIFYLFVIKQVISSAVVKKMIIVTIFLYPMAALINLMFRDIYRLQIIPYSISCLIIVIYAIYYFYELFKSTSSVNLKREPAFWIITSLLFFYTCSFPIFGFANFLSGFSVIGRNIGAVLVILNVILYSLFTVAFLCRIRVQKPML